ncbi:MAG TPA: NAD(P)H-binding protein [Polyangia bacterium]|jgi:uncharacterized protein YbjT (DUF2867 family)|nr:NAD(P)H-binding protein [Polyangia bacterium]
MLHVITGATGNIGGRVVTRLIALGERPRVLARDAAAARARFGDRVDVAVGDLADGAALAAALAGADTLFLVNSGPDLERRDALAAEAARTAGTKRLVKLSSLGARATGEATAIALWHGRGEDAIRASGVPYTFVQSVGFMSNAVAWARTIKAQGVVRASTGDGRIAMIHPEDLAAVATKALTTDAHEGQALAVTGPALLTYAEMTAKIGAVIERPLRFEPISDDEARRALLTAGMPPAVVEALVTLWREVREGLVATVTDTVEAVTGAKPASFDQWATENVAAFR